MHILLSGVAVLAALYAVLLAGLYLLQTRILFRPDRSRPDQERCGLNDFETVSISTQDGLPLLAWFKPPSGPEGCAVLYLHGNAGHIGHRASRMPAFLRHGLGVMLLEYRGYGGNPGIPSESGLIEDARSALRFLACLGFPPHRILLWGESLGTGVASALAEGAPAAALLLEAPFTSITAIARRRYPFVPVGALLRHRFDTLSRIGRVRMPVFVMHGAQDRIVPVAMGRAVHAAAQEPRGIWVAEAAGHDDLIDAGAVDAAMAFLKRLGTADVRNT